MVEYESEKEAYDLAREIYAAEEHRYENTESKIGQYLSVLFVVLGVVSVIGVDGLRSIPLAPWGNLLFVALVGLFVGAGLAAFVYFLLALRVRRIRTLEPSRPTVEYFERFTLRAALSGMAVAFFQAAEEVREQTQEKVRLARRGFDLLLVAVAFAVASGLSYVLIVKLPEAPSPMSIAIESQGRGEGQSEAGDASQVSDSAPAHSDGGEGGDSSPSDDKAEAAEAAGGLFGPRDRGFEGGSTREDRD